jgi:hypothetical protein
VAKTPLELAEAEVATLAEQMKKLEAEAASLADCQRICAAGLNLALRKRYLLLQQQKGA